MRSSRTIPVVLALLIASCKQEETHQAQAMAVVPPSATSRAPTSGQRNVDISSTGETLLKDRGGDADAVRITTKRVSFDALGNPGVGSYDERKNRVRSSVRGHLLTEYASLYRHRNTYLPLYAYVHRQQAAAVVEVITTLEHPRFLAPQDEFESDASRRNRVQEWLRQAKAIFAKHVASKDIEIFGMSVPREGPIYDANEKGWRLPFPSLPEMNAFTTRYLAGRPDVQRQLESVPLSVAPPLYAAFETSDRAVGEVALQRNRPRLVPERLFIPMPDVNRAREIKERFASGRAFYYIRFATEIVLDWREGEDARRVPMAGASYGVLLQPATVAVYTTDPLEVLVAVGRESDLWFLQGVGLHREAMPVRGAGRRLPGEVADALAQDDLLPEDDGMRSDEARQLVARGQALYLDHRAEPDRAESPATAGLVVGVQRRQRTAAYRKIGETYRLSRIYTCPFPESVTDRRSDLVLALVNGTTVTAK